MAEANPVFEAALAELGERQREEVLAGYAALEHGAEPVHEALLPALRDATLRSSLEHLLHQLGRTLVKVGGTHWTAGYRDDVTAALTASTQADSGQTDSGQTASGQTGSGQTGSAQAAGDRHPLDRVDRAILTLVLVHSVAIPRSAGGLGSASDADAWTSPHPTSPDEIFRHSHLPREETRIALGRLRAAGLVQLDRRRGTGYVPGPQFHRLTPMARRRLQEELILAAGPDTPLAAAIRIRRLHRQGES